MPRLFRRVCAALLAVIGLSLGLAACTTSLNGKTVWVVPTTIPDNCSADVTTAFNQYLSALPNNAVVDLYPNACYQVSAPLLLQDKSGLTINGNGASIEETGPIPSFSPIVNLFGDSNLTVTGLTLDGTYNGSNGGGGVEGDYGIALESDNGVTFSSDTIENTQGDWVYVEPPYDTHGGVSTNVTFNSDTFLNAGYHGFTVESAGCLTSAPCNGLTVENSTMSNMGVDAMDFEVDSASSDFVNGVCADFCQDYVTIKDNTWSGWTDSWFASLEGQGVQEDNLQLLNNTLDTTGPFMEVEQANASASNWTIDDNHYATGAYAFSYHGGGSADMELEDVSNVTMLRNGLADCPGEDAPACDGSLIHYAIQAFGVSGVVAGNNFTGNLGVFQPFANDGVTAGQCWNRIGPTAATFLDAQC